MNENNQGKNMERSRKNKVYGIMSNEEERF